MNNNNNIYDEIKYKKKNIKIFFFFYKSVKFSKKVTYCNSLSELKEHMDIKTLPIPKQVLE